MTIPNKPYTKDWGYVDSMLKEASGMGFSPAMMRLLAAKWAGEGGRRPKVGSLGLSVGEKPLKYDNIKSELSAYKDTVDKILKSKGYSIDNFNDSTAEELFNAVQYRPKGKVAGKDYYMFNDVRGDNEYKSLITGTPEYKYFTEDYIKNTYQKKSKPEKQFEIPMMFNKNVDTKYNSIFPEQLSILNQIKK